MGRQKVDVMAERLRLIHPAGVVTPVPSFYNENTSEQLLSRLTAEGRSNFRFPKVHPAEISKEFLETLGFRPAGGHLLYAARARSA